MRRLFVAGAHTDVGKTFAACALLRAARGQGLTVEALKPAVSQHVPQGTFGLGKRRAHGPGAGG